MRTALTVGTFDIVHTGHIALLRECARIADLVVVGVNTDEFVATFKRPPVLPYEERSGVIGAMRYVSAVVPNPDASLDMLLQTLRPQFLVVGTDWAPPRDYFAQIGVTAARLEELRVELVWVDRPEGSMSSTHVRSAAADHEAYVLGGRGDHR